MNHYSMNRKIFAFEKGTKRDLIVTFTSVAFPRLNLGAKTMPTIRLAYRDEDPTPVIFCIKEMARRRYDLDVEVLLFKLAVPLFCRSIYFYIFAKNCDFSKKARQEW